MCGSRVERATRDVEGKVEPIGIDHDAAELFYGVCDVGGERVAAEEEHVSGCVLDVFGGKLVVALSIASTGKEGGREALEVQLAVVEELLPHESFFFALI